ncbi:T9SS type A sorting domain-containing protein [Flavicella sediminum]|uniref:T9SS type A sorting domain-containing protein n=1 Tax=Flavicella sediminum TaxID=2585141 RepID=UPI0011234D25|nr:T9SS type A sorting domain-containing protein [Flavicella sediminum]
MQKNRLKRGSVISLLTLLIFLLTNKEIWNKSENDEKGYYRAEHGEDYEETEEEIAFEMALEKDSHPVTFDPTKLQGIELAKYNTWLNNLKMSGFKFSNKEDFTRYSKIASNNKEATNQKKEESYANNTLSGFWDQKDLALFDGSGFRADGSIYDPINNNFYVISFAGHIYKIDEGADKEWLLRNDQKSFSNNDFRLRGLHFNGINLPDGTFRLLHQQKNGGMEYSDDEGRTWITANGAFFTNGNNYKTLVSNKGTEKKIVAFGNQKDSVGWRDSVFISEDNGENYKESSVVVYSPQYETNILKPYGSNTIYYFVLRISDNRLSIYKMDEMDSDFSLVSETFPGIEGVRSLKGTSVKGTTTIYISYNNDTIFYTTNEGETWTKTGSTPQDRDIIDVHPTKPNICFSGFTRLNISFDYGQTWVNNGNKLPPINHVWDLQHFRSYEKEDGSFYTFGGFDFGSYYTSTPEVWDSWIPINRGNPTMMSYDAATSEKHNRIFSANQDRGSQSILDNDEGKPDFISLALREANTDILRVVTAKGGETAWYWYYYGTIGRSTVVGGGDINAVTKKDFYGNFTATMMIASPNSNEDAVYIPWGNQLHKISYNDGQIDRTLHPYIFPENILSFGYSEVNTNRWYVGLASGRVMYSTDGGNSFSASKYSGTWPKGSVSTSTKKSPVIATSPIDEATVYYAAKGNNFLISIDGGKTFTNHNDGLIVESILDLAATPNGQYIFAACGFDGAWVFAVQQQKWFKMNSTNLPKEVRYVDVQFIKSKNLVRYSTYGSGILDLRLNEDFSQIFISPDNFKIKVTHETCQGKNGELKIETKFNHNYEMTISGVDYNFTNTLNIPNLHPGDYDVCVGIANHNYSYCFSLEIKASSLISGKTVSKNKNSLAVDIESGTAPYSVTINNIKVLETYATSFSLPVKKGDIVQVATKATCEGKLTKIIGSLWEVKAFPNPTTGSFELNIPDSDKNITIDLYSLNSGLLSTKQYPIINNKVKMDIKNYPAGVYFLRLHVEKPKTIKIIKK